MTDRKTKIICTIGPASDQIPVLKSMVEAGMDIARLNFSHGSYGYHKRIFSRIKKVERELGRSIGILQDLEGPEVRTGRLQGGKPVELKKGSSFLIYSKDRIGDARGVGVNYSSLYRYLKGGESIFIDDGRIELRVETVTGEDILCTVVIGGMLGEKKGIHIPNVDLKFPPITQRDKDDIEFGISLGVDYIAQSFVNRADDISAIRSILKKRGREEIGIIAKIESRMGVDNIDEIIDVSDGIMIARGDLGVSIPRAEVPLVQKELIKKANKKGKPVITATQMLESMTKDPKPTRAEVTDVANAIIDGTDCVMLSGETAKGAYPVESVKEMDSIARATEGILRYERIVDRRKDSSETDLATALCYTARELAMLIDARMILVSTYSGNTARVLSWFRPPVPIETLTPRRDVLKSLIPYWGVRPHLTRYAKDVVRLLTIHISTLKDSGVLKRGDRVVMIGGRNARYPSQSNFVRVVEV